MHTYAYTHTNKQTHPLTHRCDVSFGVRLKHATRQRGREERREKREERGEKRKVRYP